MRTREWLISGKSVVLLVTGDQSLAEDAERVRVLLANTPADRTWRRRGYLVLFRAHPDRVQQDQVVSSTHHADTGYAEASGHHDPRQNLSVKPPTTYSSSKS